MNKSQRTTIRESIHKAANHLGSARELAEGGYRFSDAVLSAQLCVELSVKAILNLLDVQFPPKHGWSKDDVKEIARQINERDLLGKLSAAYLGGLVPLPRLIHRMNFWSQYYLESKYGIEAGLLASAESLFERADAEHAIGHAVGSLAAAQAIDNLEEEKLAELLPPTRKPR